MMNCNILVIGGAGYIGSHMVKMLNKHSYKVTTLDDLSTGHLNAVVAGKFIRGDYGDSRILESIFSRPFDAVMLFAGFIQVSESVQQPGMYYRNNFCKVVALLEAMRVNGTKRLIFSSTAATFGEPQYIPIDENHPQAPINPYGRSKLMVEQLLADYDKAYGIKSVSLRYFNAAGADPEGELGERHFPETHLIPLVLQVASGRRSHISIFGRDYDTPDGTCIRDFVHVQDLCSAHLLSLNSLMTESESQSYNLGNESGFSVQEVIDMTERVTGKKIPVRFESRRTGDPARLVANSKLIQRRLGWQPQYSDLNTIIEHAWNWELQHFSSHSPSISTR